MVRTIGSMCGINLSPRRQTQVTELVLTLPASHVIAATSELDRNSTALSRTAFARIFDHLIGSLDLAVSLLAKSFIVLSASHFMMKSTLMSKAHLECAFAASNDIVVISVFVQLDISTSWPETCNVFTLTCESPLLEIKVPVD